MTTPMIKHRVDSLHINVGAGDSAIHLLVDPLAIEGGKPTVKRACLIDGGPSRPADRDIQFTIEKIKDNYHLSLDHSSEHDGVMRFDSVVITHWDEDHYGGIVQLLDEDLGNQWEHEKPDDFEESLKEQAEEKINEVMASFECRYFRYEGPGKSSPKTTLYAPNWQGTAKKHFTGTNPPGIDQDRPSDLEGLEGARTLTFEYSYKYYLKKVGEPPTKRPKSQVEVKAHIPNLCNLCYKPEEMIGVNFFDNARPTPPSSYPKINDPAELKALVNGTDGAPVGMYCVACFGRVIGSDQSFGKIPPKSEFYMDKSASRETNRASIGAIILWRDPDKITHYFAGDAWWVVEEQIAKWINQEVSCMKLSHHGALNSTPFEMLNTFKPENIVISAGDRHGHPRWGTLMYLNAWLYKNKKTRAVFATNYPYYCQRAYDIYSDDDCVRYITGAIQKDEREFFYDAMEKMYKDLKVQGLREQAKTWKTKFIDEAKTVKNDKYNYTAWVTWQVQNAWEDNLSAMYQDRIPSVTAPIRSTSEDQIVDYILIRSELKTRSGPKDVTPPNIKISVHVGRRISPSLDAFEDRDGGEQLGRLLALDPTEVRVLYDNVSDDLLIRPSRSQYHIMDDAQHLGTLNGTLPRTEALFTEEGYWLGPVDGAGINAVSDPHLNRFVSHLHYRKFGLLARPEASSQTGFLANEEWNCWFADALSSQSLQLSTNSQTEPSAFLFEMIPPFAEAARLNFNTQLVRLAFDPPPASLSTLGLIGDTNVMVFGLDTKGSLKVETTFPKILSYIKLKVLEDSPLVKAFGDQHKLYLSTEPGARNFIWFDPGLAYRTTLRLQWEMDTRTLSKILKPSGITFDVTKVLVITTRTTSWRPDLTMIPRGELRLDMTIKGPSVVLLGSITAGEDSFGVTVTAENCSWTDFLNWLTETVTDIDISPISQHDSPLSNVKDLFSTGIVPRRVSFEVRQVSDSKHSLKSWTVSFEITIKSVAFLVTYSSAIKMLRGQIWLDPGDVGVRKILPGWEENKVLRPSPGAKSELDLADLSPDGGVDSIPNGIPTKLREVSVTIDPKSITFFASLVCSPPTGGEPIPAITLGTVELSARYLFQGTDRISLKVYCKAILGQRKAKDGEDDDDDDDDDSASSQYGATLEGVLAYYEGVWTLAGSINGLNFSSIYSLLDPHAQDDVLSVLGKLTLSNLELVYEYQKDGKGSNFLLTGSLLLGKLELAMTYTYSSNGWSFTAELGSSMESETLGAIVKSIVGPDGDVLPGFIANIPITGGGNGDKLVTIHCRKSAKSGNPSDSREDYYILFQATLKIHVFGKTSVEVTFAQYRDLDLNAKDPAKRILKVSLMGLPTVTVPTLGELPQPFDEMLYLWVQDKNVQANKSNKAGLTQQEVEYLNRGVPTSNAEQAHSSGDWLFYRDTRKPEARKPTDLVIGAGSHFMVMLNAQNQRQAILDYVFQAELSPKLLESTPYYGTVGSGGNGNSAMAAYQRTAGPISISNIGLKYKNNVLSVLLDASFVLGPVGFTFLGAAIEINLQDKNFHDLKPKDVGFGLTGFIVAFDRPPLRLAGMFTHGKAPGMTYYAGGIVVGFDPYQFRAAGMYGEVSKPEAFTTAFVYAKLEGPLVTLAFAEISGITGGFGYNSEVTKPTIETVRNFPFIESKDIQDDLLGTLEDLIRVDGSGAFTIRNGSMWLAAGLKVSAFKMLTIDAVIVISWNPSVSVDICGVAVVDIPKGTKVPFAHVELGILATLDFGAGVFKVEAQLAPSSYIFDSSCRLTGGFALYYWFNDRVPELRGDWVFTIGGYHRGFDKPVHYPNPPRLGISWQVGSNISIVGEAYFAITPKCCMGGGRLRATLSAGPLTAWYATWADFLIKYQPFYFLAEAGVSIGINCKVDLLITSFTVSVEVGASLLLEGPPLHGRIHIDFWVMSFDINFGPDADSPPPPNLEQFYEMVLQSEDQQSLAAMFIAPMAESNPTATSKKDHVFTCRGGLVERKGEETVTQENANWDVKMGSFVFAIDVRFALSEAVVEPPKEFGPNPELEAQKFILTKEIHAKPMENKKAISSFLHVTIEPPPTIYSTLERDEISNHNWKVQEITKEVPSALWGPYDEAQDPRLQGNHIGSLLDQGKGTIPMLMGLEIRPPDPKLADDKIGKFDAVKAMEQGVFSESEMPDFPNFDDQRTDWSPSDDRGTSVADQYKHVKDVWRTTSEDQRKVVTDALAQGLAWRKKLTAATPKRLVADLGNRYMRAPKISVR